MSVASSYSVLNASRQLFASKYRAYLPSLAAMRKATSAWESHSPGSTLYGLTLAKFKAALQPGHDARAEIEDLQKRLRAAISRRDVADVRSMRILRGVAFGVKGDPDHTEDGALYAATGFVRKSARRKRRRQKK